jgi:catechol 2,3-dioxygenase-like lactoylglutathione lyase family enzyme
MERPAATIGMRHVALNVRDLEACEYFYVQLLGMTVEWRPDADNVYLTSGSDNLALHRVTGDAPAATGQRLDHIGFFIASPELVDDWHAFLRESAVEIKVSPRTHRDGARSFYCADPEGTIVQLIFHPPIVA